MPSDSKPHSQKVRGTLDHPIVKENIKKGNVPKWGEDPTSKEPELDNVQDASQVDSKNRTDAPASSTSDSQTHAGGKEAKGESSHKPDSYNDPHTQDTFSYARKAGVRGPLADFVSSGSGASKSGISKSSESSASPSSSSASSSSEGAEGALPHSKTVRGTLGNQDTMEKVQKGEIPKSGIDPTSKKNELEGVQDASKAKKDSKL